MKIRYDTLVTDATGVVKHLYNLKGKCKVIVITKLEPGFSMLLVSILV